MIMRLVISCFLLFPMWSVAQEIPLISLSNDLPSYNPGLLFLSGQGTAAGLNYRQSLIGKFRQNHRIAHVFVQHNWDLKERNSWFSAGIQLSHEGAPEFEHWQDKIHVQISYAKRLFNVGQWSHVLSAGIRFSYGLLTSNNHDYWFGNQYDIENQEINRLLPSGENSSILEPGEQAFRDIGLGLNWWALRKEQWSLNGGIAVYELIDSQKAKTSLRIDPQRRYVLLISANYKATKDIAITATSIFETHVPFEQWKFQSGLLFKPGNATQKAWYQLGLGMAFANHVDDFGWQSAMMYTKIQVGKMAFGISYLFPLSGLRRYTDRRGGIEINLEYRPGIKRAMHWF